MNSTTNDTDRKDLRPLVLFLFVLVILAVAAARQGGFFNLSGKVAIPQKLVWRNDPVASGLYRMPAGSIGSAGEASAPFSARLAPLFFQPIPINQADEELLISIPGIGPAFAKRIIEFRDYYGRINAIEELDAVKGIGPVKLEILKTHLVAD